MFCLTLNVAVWIVVWKYVHALDPHFFYQVLKDHRFVQKASNRRFVTAGKLDECDRPFPNFEFGLNCGCAQPNDSLICVFGPGNKTEKTLLLILLVSIMWILQAFENHVNFTVNCVDCLYLSSQLWRGKFENLKADKANIPKLIVLKERVCFPSSNLMSKNPSVVQ